MAEGHRSTLKEMGLPTCVVLVLVHQEITSIALQQILARHVDSVSVHIICLHIISVLMNRVVMSQIPREKSIGYVVHEVARAFRRRFEEEARAHGLTLPQWRTLVEIDKQGDITQVALASLIDTDPMTVSGILDRLEKRGLIERLPHPSDSRAKLSRLTEEGTDVVAMARNVGLQLYQNAVSGLSTAQLDAVMSGLLQIRENLNNLDQVAVHEKEAV